MIFPLLDFFDMSNHRAFAAKKLYYFLKNEYVKTFLGITVLVIFGQPERRNS